MKKIFSLNRPSIYIGSCLLVMLLFVFACKKELYTQNTTDDVNIAEYFEKHPDEFSLMTEIINRTGDAGYLAAYGDYTLFTPNNTAIKKWLQAKGKSSIDAVPLDSLKQLVRFHLIADTVGTETFTDGKLKQLTLYGQYLLTGSINENGTSSYIINKQAKIIKSNIRLGNGIVHVLDNVLEPARKTLAQMIDESPRYEIFTQALIETGFYDSLNRDQSQILDSTKRFQTVILESDSAFQASGISSYAALKAKLSKVNPRDPADSLWKYVAYHISPGASYLADIVVKSSLTTYSGVLQTKLEGQKVLLDDLEFNGVHEPGVEVSRMYSDITASNGVIHESKNFYNLKLRLPTPIYWDVTTQPEFIALTTKYRTSTFSILSGGKTIAAGITVDRPTAGTPQEYGYGATNRYYNLNDCLSLSVSTSNTLRIRSLELTTPLIAAGTYKVWVCYGYNSAGPSTQVTMDAGTADEFVFPNLMEFNKALGSTGVVATDPNRDNLLEMNGYKRYMANATEKQVNKDGVVESGNQPVSGTGWDVNPARLIGRITFKSTATHVIKFYALTGNASSNTFLDMIHFIPVDNDQQWPKFSRSGLMFKKP